MTPGQLVHIIEDDPGVAVSLAALFERAGLNARIHTSLRHFLQSDTVAGCVVSDVRMHGMSGLELLEEMKRRRIPTPVILMTAFPDVPLAVKAMKLGAFDFIEKPFDDKVMVSSVRAALARLADDATAAREKLECLSAREKNVLAGLIKGKPNKIIAYELGISVRTVETHRANLMAKTQARSLPALIRMSFLAGWLPNG